MKTIFFSVLFLGLSVSAFSQGEDLKDINTQIWANFTKAFENLDYQLFSDLHSANLVRVGGDSKSVKGKTAYIKGYENRWKEKKLKQTISFRFLERIAKNGKASERGIYKLTIDPNTEKEKSYYGKFHVIHRKENGVWKILVDYDSSENNSINETSFLKAFAINDFNINNP
ncbi:YybH family protein [Seonamhaeicola maritimus]|uniref:Nuclear transport factor 2 family protein n=1 Tax=Seonamhaeicola maritimus TaxID=2591822 RepID=A0A5C7GM26_9FLAO|nr:nuclear transport factor 2 family protein [Seonamhaeicola maritimus]TXG39393.1 nuclear transport factor 2 family protein [Seonamhaeicola maritimus]